MVLFFWTAGDILFKTHGTTMASFQNNHCDHCIPEIIKRCISRMKGSRGVVPRDARSPRCGGSGPSCATPWRTAAPSPTCDPFLPYPRPQGLGAPAHPRPFLRPQRLVLDGWVGSHVIHRMNRPQVISRWDLPIYTRPAWRYIPDQTTYHTKDNTI